MLPTPVRLAQSAGHLKVAVIGAGPSGFYASARLLSAFPKDAASSDTGSVEVHMYERLPTPHGLVRYGVAPDHPDVKNVIHKFDQIAQDPRFSFFGNVNVDAPPPRSHHGAYQYPLAVPLSLTSLAQHYTHLVLTYGASLPRPLGIPGSGPGELRNVHSALDYVNWYNGHPAAHDEAFLSRVPWRRSAPPPSPSGGSQRMAVVGAGNVALDVARITLLSGASSLLRPGGDSDATASASRAKAQLAQTDIPEPVLAALSSARIAHVDVFARRGPAQLAMTNKELREMMALPGIAFEGVDAALLQQAREDVARGEQEAKQRVQGGEGAQSARARKRLLDLLAKGSTTRLGQPDASHSWALRFFRSPAALHGRSDAAHTSPPVCEGEWNVTQLPSPPAPTPSDAASAPKTETWGNNPDGPAVAIPTGATERLPADIVVSSVGYRSEPLGGSSSLSFPFDLRRGLVPNDAGRVADPPRASPGLYVAGWLASGPVGVIASTMYGAYGMADTLLADWRAGAPHLRSAEADIVPGALPAELQGSQRVVRYGDWLRIDEAERRRGRALGKEREKFLSVKEMLDVVS